MLTWLGLATIVGVLALILFRITSVLVALTLVPIAAALAGGFGSRIGGFAMEGIASVAPVAALLAFAVVYFGVMNDAGLFDPAIRAILKIVHRSPVRIALGTAAIASLAHLDGAGASTFMVAVPAMLPIYKRVGMRPLALTAIVALAAGTMNMLPNDEIGGTIGSEQYNVWRANFGKIAGGGAGSSRLMQATVPEPSGVALVTSGLIALCYLRQRHRQN